uniref:NADH-ubiquinone oxidoreductase chain 4 n=1 Tax=Zonosagitta nagae TaxID=648573 RepID=A0A0U1SZS7_9BILA|nr:NADH dehydrogenase subunit 4 [Zonosagitta nagae]
MSLVILSFWVFQGMYVINSIKMGSLFHYLCVSLLSVVLCFFLSSKMISFYIFFELSLIPTLFLVFFFGYQPEKLQASMYLLMYTVMSSLPLLMIFIKMSGYILYISTSTSVSIVLFMTLGFMVKTPMYLVHVWLPKAHVEAPVAGSMVLAGILLKLGSYGLILFCPVLSGVVLYFYLSLSVWGSIFCSMICIRQSDLKGLIAYSSVVHMGVVTVGVVSGLEIGYSCALMMVIAHGVCSPMLFAVAFLVYSSSHTRVLSNNKGSLSTPVLSFILFLLLAINMGVPPSVNLWSEVYMFISFISMMTISIFFLVVIAFVGVVYNLFMYITLSQSKEFDFSKTDYIYWPLLSACLLGFLLFPFLGVFSVYFSYLNAISITLTMFRLSLCLPEVTGDMCKSK